MVWRFTVLTVPLLVSGTLAAAGAAIAWRRRSKSAAVEMVVSMVGHSLWMFGQGLSISTVPAWATQFWFTVSKVGILLAGAGWLAFGLAYTGRDEWLTRRRLAVLALVPAVTVPLSLFNPWDLAYVDPVVTDAGRFEYGWGPVAYVEFVYIAATGSAGVALLGKKLVHSRNYYRRSAFWLALLSSVSVTCFVLSFTGLSPLPHFTLWPAVFFVVGPVSILVMTRLRVLTYLPLGRFFSVLGARYDDVVPVARNVVVEELSSGVVVLDSKNRIVDINAMGRRMLGLSDRKVVGRRIETVVDTEALLTDDRAFLDPDVTDERFESVWVHGEDGTRRCYDIQITDLSERRDDLSGRVGVIHDVTEKRHRERELRERTEELERQNERLDNFAGVVSHDLRNPLATARGYVDMAEESGDPEYFEEIRYSLDRMDDIIEDVLTFAREGQRVTDPEPVDLDEVVREAWATVDTRGATLEGELDAVVDADPERLLRVFENLFRNAVEHGSAGDGTRADDDPDRSGRGPTIRVGPLADGFYVEDDGPGIPEDRRTGVLEQGYTTSADGTGFGLAIVETIVEAHGWTVEVGAGERGGARFEVTGCDPRPVASIDA